jgi:SAM-dependent methyltransferase
VRCEVCGDAADPFLTVRGYPIRRCRGCGYHFVEYDAPQGHTDLVYGDDYFAGGAGGYPDYPSEERILREHGRRYARLLARHLPPGRLLDVGAAAGFLLGAFVAEGWSGIGIEPNARMAELGRRRGLDVREGTLEDLPDPGPFDLVTMVQVVAHFVAPRAALAAAARATRPGGFWLVETWDPRSVTARLLRAHWHAFNPPSVLHLFPPRSLGLLAAQHGLRLVARGRPAKRISAGHAKAALDHAARSDLLRRALATAGRLVPDDAVLPYPAEDLYWALFRKEGVTT